MGRKADLQYELTKAGVPFGERDTIADLEDALADVEIVDGEPEDVDGTPDDVPAVEGSPTELAKREARRQARRDEAALAALNRANDVAAAKAKVRTAAQQALDRAGGSA